MPGYERIQAEQALVQSALAIEEFLATHIAIYLTLLFGYIAVAYVLGGRIGG